MFLSIQSQNFASTYIYATLQWNVYKIKIISTYLLNVIYLVAFNMLKNLSCKGYH